MWHLIASRNLLHAFTGPAHPGPCLPCLHQRLRVLLRGSWRPTPPRMTYGTQGGRWRRGVGALTAGAVRQPAPCITPRPASASCRVPCFQRSLIQRASTTRSPQAQANPHAGAPGQPWPASAPHSCRGDLPPAAGSCGHGSRAGNCPQDKARGYDWPVHQHQGGAVQAGGCRCVRMQPHTSHAFHTRARCFPLK